MSTSPTDSKTQSAAKAAFTERRLSDAELETVAAAGDGGKQDPKSETPAATGEHSIEVSP